MALDDRSRAGAGDGTRAMIANACRWTLCAACLTVYDDYGFAVNPIPEYAKVH
jgi:hypothetical protein